MLSNKVSNIQPSTTLAITATAQKLKDEGIDVIGLGAGQPDFNTPDFIIEGAINAIHNGQTKYTPSGGILPLKEAIVNKTNQDLNLNYNTSNVFVGTGAKHVLYNIFMSILNEGDEVIVPVPYWVSYPEQIKLAGGTPVFVKTDEETNFKLTTSQLEQHINDNTKAIIINTPSNPTGMIYSKEELLALDDLIKQHDLIVISDEIYETLIYNGKHVSYATLNEDAKDRTFIVNGVSKSHAMTGWRIGYGIGPVDYIKGMTNLASHSTSNPTTPSQYAALTAYTEQPEYIQQMNEIFKKRLDEVYPLVDEITGFKCIKPNGAFYLYPNVKEAMNLCGYNSSSDFAQALLEEAHVAVIPGSAFGSDDNIRLSYATDVESFKTAIERIKHFINSKKS